MIRAFAMGFFAEFAWLTWIYCAAQAWPLRCAGASMLIGAFSFLGTKAGLESRGRAVALIVGYGAGSATAAYLKGLL